MRRIDRRIGSGAALLAVALLAGCHPPNAGAGPWQNLQPEPKIQVADAELFHYLTTGVDVINQNQAYRAILIWIDGKDPSSQFGQRITALQAKGLVQPDWVHDPLEPLSRERLAEIICRRYDIRSSVTLVLFGPTGRYCRRELEFRGVIVRDRSGLMSGAEFVNILKRADEKIGGVAGAGPGADVPESVKQPGSK